MKRFLLSTIVMSICCVLTVSADSKKTPAFPGAEGFGMYVTGGRGGKVYHVTTLEDTGKAGSLRYAVTQSGARTVVFDVSGTIHLKSALGIKGDVTIAGQTAPGDGICIADWPVTIDGANVIIRYLRFRLGNTYVCKEEGDGGHQGDGLGAMDGANIIVDHCSISWSIDECLSVYGNRNTTVQWCMAYQSLREAGHIKGAHGYGGMMGGGRVTYHHNLLADHDSRTPRFAFRSGDDTSIETPTDYRNNVIYNYGKNGCYGGEEMEINIVNNYYKPGPFTKMQRESYQKRISGVGQGTHYNEDGSVKEYVWGHYYVNGNVNSSWADVTNDNWNIGFLNQIADKLKTSTYAWGSTTADTIHMTEPMPFALVTTHSAADAYEKVVSYAGCSLHRDSLDRVIASDVRSGKCTFSADASSRPGIINVPEEAKTDGDDAWPRLNSEAAPVDSDGDGMPDEWETANGLNPNDASDGPTVGSDGYTNLENYLNSIVADITAAQLEGGTVEGEDVATTGPLFTTPVDESKAITLPSDDYFDLTMATLSGGNVNSTGSAFPILENLRTSQTATFVLNNTVEQAYVVSFKGCTKKDNVNLNFFISVDNKEELNQDVAVKNNGSWYDKFDDYSFTTDVLSVGVKNLVITFTADKYTANIGQIKFTPVSQTGIESLRKETLQPDNITYSISGVRMPEGEALPKGIYIRNGKKIVIK